MLKYYLIFIGVMSVITLILYGADKAKAKKHAWRIKEAVLLLFGLFGGALGGLIGMEIFRHKTRHWYFRYGLPLIMAVQLVAGAWLIGTDKVVIM